MPLESMRRVRLLPCRGMCRVVKCPNFCFFTTLDVGPADSASWDRFTWNLTAYFVYQGLVQVRGTRFCTLRLVVRGRRLFSPRTRYPL